MQLLKEEIKIGNYFKYIRDGIIQNITWEEYNWYQLRECIIDIEEIMPIIISTFQLEKLGYRKINRLISGYEYWVENDYSNFAIRKNANGNWQMCAVQGINIFAFDPILQYVHQLQNLHYSLTDRELKYK